MPQAGRERDGFRGRKVEVPVEEEEVEGVLVMVPTVRGDETGTWVLGWESV